MKIDLSNDTATAVGPLGVPGIVGLAVDPSGQMYGAEGGSGPTAIMFHINTMTGAATEIGVIADASSLGVTGLSFDYPLSPVPTLTALRASTTSAVVGQSVTFTATVSDLSAGGATPNGGTVTFSDQSGAIGIEALVGGVATFTTSSLPLGTDTFTASYGGTAEFAPSSTAGTIVTVTPALPTSGTHSTKVLLTAKPRPSNFGQKVTFVAAVESVGHSGGQPIGDVTFFDGAIVLERDVALKAGKATLRTSSLIVGTHRIWVQYSGGGNFEASRSIFLNEKVRAGRSKRLVSTAEILD